MAAPLRRRRAGTTGRGAGRSSRGAEGLVGGGSPRDAPGPRRRRGDGGGGDGPTAGPRAGGRCRGRWRPTWCPARRLLVVGAAGLVAFAGKNATATLQSPLSQAAHRRAEGRILDVVAGLELADVEDPAFQDRLHQGEVVALVGRTARARPPWPRSCATCTSRVGHGSMGRDRHRPVRSRRRAVTGRRRLPGLRPLPVVHRGPEHRHRTTGAHG